MTDEYKILQDKIDKIGAFRFTIKGWAVTAVIGATAAASAANSLTAALVVSSGLAILVYFFFRFEVEQVRLSRLFGLLAGNIEQAFDDIDRGTLRRWFPSPLVATEIVRSKQSKNRPNRFKWWMLWRYVGVRHHSARKAWRKGVTEDWGVWRSAHVAFYIVLLVLAFVPVATRYKSVVTEKRTGP